VEIECGRGGSGKKYIDTLIPRHTVKHAGLKSIYLNSTAPSTISLSRLKTSQSSSKLRMAAVQGGCLCGKVRYQYTGSIHRKASLLSIQLTIPKGDIALKGFCNCKDCQRWGGAPGMANVVVPRDTFKVTSGMLNKDRPPMAHRRNGGADKMKNRRAQDL